MNEKKIIIAGFGGQGIVLAGVIYVVFRVVTLLRKQRVYVPRGAAEPDAPFSVKDALRERANSQRDPP